ncbi:thioredoxin [Saccharospirillum sp. MSK14-1]|uniref:thioredoxin n=1 Tax=Saccharospirillum sp. MSK14-1 TaxID=1897632 RepID=UPI000D37CBFB|nr:thioredoxin [Saccharospirillum sp. MSK14-1]PTY38650.1 thioredoxin [Saccharospirillum sp. MSK14-1]
MSAVTMLNAEQFAQSVEGGEGLTLVDFYADWCGPCKMIAPVLEDLAGEYDGKVTIVKLDADAHPDVLAKYGVRGLPTLMMFENGKPVGTRVGAQPASALKTFIGEHAS